MRRRKKKRQHKNLYDGIKFASGFEVKFYKNLKVRKIKVEYEPDKLQYVLKPKVYTPDFKIKKRDGSEMYIETKGYWRVDDRLKMLAVIQQNPDKDIRMVFSDASKKIYKNSKTTYAQYCNTHNIKWAEGIIPKEWLRKGK